MLAFDIETTGLDRERCQVTVVCTEDFHTGEKRAYEFGRVSQGGEEAGLHALTEQLVEALDAAESLCAFNGVRFDLPFLYKALRLPEATVAGWMVKTTDILEACRLQVFGPRHTFGLNLLCQHNGVPMKSSSGCEAVRMAAQGRWQELLDYCADDVRILCDLYRRKVLRNPRGWQPIDLQRIAHDSLYAPAGLAGPDQTAREAPVEEAPKAPAEAVNAECAQLRLEVHDLRQQLQAQQLKLEVYRSICTCLDAFDTDLGAAV
jgi:hypothetical protein